MSGAETTELSEQNQVLMMLLKVSCEVKQDSHEVGWIKYFPIIIKIFSAHWSLASNLPGERGDAGHGHSRPGALHAGGRQVSQEIAG